ncbi:MAG: hypothetical protein U0176_21390 [Bacteroidia bacterium]
MKLWKHCLWVGALTLLVLGCSKIDKILPRQDGLWNVVNLNTITYVDDSLVSNTDETDSLGRYYFDKQGIGYLEDALGERSDFTWEVNEENDWVTLTDTSGAATVMEVVESSNKEQVWTTSLYQDNQGVITRRDITATLNRE